MHRQPSASLLPDLAQRALLHTELLQPQVAVSIDARNLPSQLQRFPELLQEVRDNHINCDVLYLDADDETLLKRFSETRRRHPLTTDTRSLAEAIGDEPIARTDRRPRRPEAGHHQPQPLSAARHHQTAPVEQAGARHRVPRRILWLQARHASRRRPGVRCALPAEPYWKPELRDHSGLEPEVREYLAAQPDVEEMYQDIVGYLNKWLPRFAASNRSYVTVAIGCTGGHHRSVYLAERIGAALRDSLKNVQIRHRDLSS